MSTSDLNGRRILACVAQSSFASGSNYFSTVWPLLMREASGNKWTACNKKQFPNDGRVFWMLRPEWVERALPGTLVVGDLETTPRFEAHRRDKQFYALKRDSVKDPGSDVPTPILSVKVDPAEAVASSAARTVDIGVHTAPMYATRAVLLWEQALIGFFGVSSVPSDDASLWHLSAFCLEKEALRSVPSAQLASEFIKTTAMLTADAHFLHATSRELSFLSREGVAALATATPPAIDPAFNPFAIFEQAAKHLATRKERQQLKSLLEKLRASAPMAQHADLSVAINSITKHLATPDPALDEFLRLIAGEPAVRKALDEKRGEDWEAYVAKKADAERSTLALQIRAVEAELLEKRQALALEASALEAQAARRREEEAAAEERRVAWAQREAEVKAREQGLVQLLGRVSEGRQALAADVVLLSKLLEDGRKDTDTVSNPPRKSQTAVAEERRNFDVPKTVTEERGTSELLAEKDFLLRFETHTKKSGFVFDPRDLRRFHLSVKLEPLTILAGPAGVGKSSLPRLYAEAIVGAGPGLEERFHLVGVSPAWLDRRDLLGFANALTGDFQPAETGLWERLAWAQREWDLHGDESGLWIVVLDEMNLATIEHYFHDFIVALEAREGEGKISCFQESAISPESPYRGLGTLRIPPTVRFVGTVNLDETTKPLSRRLLDRANVITLGIPAAQDGVGNVAARKGEGLPARMRELRAWQGVRPKRVSEAGRRLRDLETHLEKCDCPTSPRRRGRIMRAIECGGSLAEDAYEILDWQVAQRILPDLERQVTASSPPEVLDELLEALKRPPSLELSARMFEILKRRREAELM